MTHLAVKTSAPLRCCSRTYLPDFCSTNQEAFHRGRCGHWGGRGRGGSNKVAKKKKHNYKFCTNKPDQAPTMFPDRVPFHILNSEGSLSNTIMTMLGRDGLMLQHLASLLILASDEFRWEWFSGIAAWGWQMRNSSWVTWWPRKEFHYCSKKKKRKKRKKSLNKTVDVFRFLRRCRLSPLTWSGVPPPIHLKWEGFFVGWICNILDLKSLSKVKSKTELIIQQWKWTSTPPPTRLPLPSCTTT